jgi:release factor glutamine methyltransferase
VEQAIALAREFTEPRIVDVGAGSGAIAVVLAVHLAGARITTIDVSADALALARENAARNAVSEQLRFLQGDLLEPVAGEQFDLVVSNPPYVPERDRGSLSVEVREYEPSQALFAGEDGLDVYRRLIPAGYAVLAPGGYMLLEIGYGQAEGVRALLAGSGFKEIDFVPDLQGIARVACGRR